MLTDRLEDGGDQEQRLVQQDSPAGLFQESKSLEDIGLGLGPEPLLPCDRARLGGRSQVGEALDLQRVAQGLDLLGAETRHLE